MSLGEIATLYSLVFACSCLKAQLDAAEKAKVA